jgi:hypothetical protein
VRVGVLLGANELLRVAQLVATPAIGAERVPEEERDEDRAADQT